MQQFTNSKLFNSNSPYKTNMLAVRLANSTSSNTKPDAKLNVHSLPIPTLDYKAKLKVSFFSVNHFPLFMCRLRVGEWLNAQRVCFCSTGIGDRKGKHLSDIAV